MSTSRSLLGPLLVATVLLVGCSDDGDATISDDGSTASASSDAPTTGGGSADGPSQGSLALTVSGDEELTVTLPGTCEVFSEADGGGTLATPVVLDFDPDETDTDAGVFHVNPVMSTAIVVETENATAYTVAAPEVTDDGAGSYTFTGTGVPWPVAGEARVEVVAEVTGCVGA